MNSVLLILTTILMGNMHPIHISLTNIEYSSEKEAFVVAVKIFTDDLETVINRKYNIESNIGKTNEFVGIEDYYSKYLNEHFKFLVNGKKNLVSDMKLIKKEKNFEATWLYYEVEYDGKIADVKVRASFLDDLYPDQKNLLIFNYKGKNKGFQFKVGDEPEEFQLK